MSGVEGRAMLLSAAVTVLVVLVAGTAATPRKFSQDQYEQQPRRDRAIAVTEHADVDKLLHRVHLDGHHHRFNAPVTHDKNHHHHHHQRELQVGCAEGAIDTESHRDAQLVKNDLHVRTPKQDSEVPKNILHPRQPSNDSINTSTYRHSDDDVAIINTPRRKRQTSRREFITWHGNTPASTALLRQTYQIPPSQLPYWIPIWGNPRRIPVYFPAKPILFNPGYPVKNRPSSQTTTIAAPTDSGVLIGNRINIPDDRPIWGVVSQDVPPAQSQTPIERPSMERPTMERPRKPPTPPLLHRPSLGDETVLLNQASNSVQQVTQAPVPAPVFPQQTQTPALVFPQQTQAPQQQIQPVFVPQRTTTRRSTESRQNPVQQQGPNRCVWAIISCCSPASQQVRSNCFERLGCPGSFWDVNPCSREVTAAALNAAQMFYDQS